MAAYVYDFGVQGGRLASGSQPPGASLSQRTVDSKYRDDAAMQAGTPPGHTQVPAAQTQDPSSPSMAVRATNSHSAVLGLSGTDWVENGATGVEILQVFDDSSAQLAGLTQLEPGTQVSIAYLYRSNLGWMPKETIAILSHE